MLRWYRLDDDEVDKIFVGGFIKMCCKNLYYDLFMWITDLHVSRESRNNFMLYKSLATVLRLTDKKRKYGYRSDDDSIEIDKKLLRMQRGLKRLHRWASRDDRLDVLERFEYFNISDKSTNKSVRYVAEGNSLRCLKWLLKKGHSVLDNRKRVNNY